MALPVPSPAHSRKRKTRRRIGGVALAAVAVFLFVAVVIWQRFSTQSMQPDDFLAHVVQLEQQADLDPGSRQSLGWSLAILGRDDEVRDLDFFPQYQPPVSKVDFARLDLPVVPWEEALSDIAAQHRLVMIMEDHCVSKHREFIGGTLPVFQSAGFTHYAAEAIGPLDSSLMQRGYPTSGTGLYTSDPQFGNAIRRALDLGFTVLGYDFRPFTHDDREEFAATQLAVVLQQNADTRLLVHAGHAHVLKDKTLTGERWLAGRLWEQTGIDPFTIWQWSSQHDARDYAEVVRVLQDRGISFDEPMLLMPPPPLDCGLQDSPYGLARVDAIVLHPPDDSIAPDRRTTLFPDQRQLLSGIWTGNGWPVVVSAYKNGEPIDAVPLDQVLLRPEETRFRLWILPGANYQIRVFNRHGLLASRVDVDDGTLSVSLANRQ